MLAGGNHNQSLPTAVLGSLLVGVLPRVKLCVGKLIRIWSLQLGLFAILDCQEVSLWDELEDASDSQGSDDLGT